MSVVRAGVLFGMAAFAAVPAAARSLQDCEKISAPLAYNECLSEFMPARRHPGVPAPKVDLSQVPFAQDAKPGSEEGLGSGLHRLGRPPAASNSQVIILRGGADSRFSADIGPQGSGAPRLRRLR